MKLNLGMQGREIKGFGNHAASHALASPKKDKDRLSVGHLVCKASITRASPPWIWCIDFQHGLFGKCHFRTEYVSNILNSRCHDGPKLLEYCSKSKTVTAFLVKQ